MMELDPKAPFNTLYKHFYYFVKEFNLIEESEYAPLADLTKRIYTD